MVTMSNSAVGAKQRIKTDPAQPALRLMGLLAHQISQPVTVLLGEVELARQCGRGEEELKDTLERCFHHLERAARLVSDLRMVGEMSQATARWVSLVEMMDGVVEAQEAEADLKGVKIDWKTALDMAVETDPDVLQRALSIMLRRAVRATSAGGAVKTRVEEHMGDAEIRFTYSEAKADGSKRRNHSGLALNAPAADVTEWALAENMTQLLGGSLRHWQSSGGSQAGISLVLGRALFQGANSQILRPATTS